jgi:hypothetical protein
MPNIITLNSQCLVSLDISPVQTMIASWQEDIGAACSADIQFQIDYHREPNDPRELSEIPEIRMWFIRLDAQYPWLPLCLDWKAGELARYAAMLVPHQFHRTEGIKYNPEALEIFLMNKIFTIAQWLKQQGVPSKSKLMSMANLLGYDLDESLFDFLETLA